MDDPDPLPLVPEVPEVPEVPGAPFEPVTITSQLEVSIDGGCDPTGTDVAAVQI
jgi:hypothetical protein